MAAKEGKGVRRGTLRQGPDQSGRAVGPAIHAAIARGFIVGCEVLVGSIPGIVVGYNIASIGQFVGTAYPLVVRTALGVTKCGVDEVTLL